MSDKRPPKRKALIWLCCGHKVPSKLNKVDDDLGWCPKCKRWLYTGKLT